MIAVRRVLILSVVVVLLLTGCGGPATQVGDKSSDFLLALPRITVDFDSEGVPSLSGMSPDMLRMLTFGQLDMTQYRIPKEYVDWFTRTDLQHLELLHKDDGLFVFANGKPLPHVTWDSKSFATAGDTVEALGMMDAATSRMVKTGLPFVSRVGMDVVFRFPRQASAKAIPVRETGEKITSQLAQTFQGTPSVQMRIVVNFTDQGVPSIADLSTRDLEESTGYSFRMAELDPALVKRLMDANIQHISMRTTGNGLLLTVNGKVLPSLEWSDAYLKNSTEVVGNLYGAEAYKDVMQVADTILPQLKTVDAEVVVRFPVAAGATAIPLGGQ